LGGPDYYNKTNKQKAKSSNGRQNTGTPYMGNICIYGKKLCAVENTLEKQCSLEVIRMGDEQSSGRVHRSRG